MSLIKREKLDRYSLSDCKVISNWLQCQLDLFSDILKDEKIRTNQCVEDIEELEMDVECYSSMVERMDDYMDNRISRIFEET